MANHKEIDVRHLWEGGWGRVARDGLRGDIGVRPEDSEPGLPLLAGCTCWQIGRSSQAKAKASVTQYAGR